MSRVLVFGSINLDVVMGVSDLPRPGETVVSDHLRWAGGGKGANQAHAAAKAGASTSMIGCLGDDDSGERMLTELAEHGVDTSAITRVGHATGVAAVIVDSSSENVVIAYPGANAHWPSAHVDSVRIEPDDVVIVQLEIPLDIVAAVLTRATNAGATTVLNAAPMRPGVREQLELVDVLVVNEVEMRDLFDADPTSEQGISDALASIRGDLVVTLGSKGAFVAQRDGARHQIKANVVQPIDTVGAGDAFVGALGAAVAEGQPLSCAVRLANAAGALTATVRGARHPDLDRAQLDALAGAAV